MSRHVCGVAPIGRLVRWVCSCGAAGPSKALVRMAKMGGAQHVSKASRGTAEFLHNARAAWQASGRVGRWLDASREYASELAVARSGGQGQSNRRVRLFWSAWLMLWRNVGAMHAQPSAGFAALR